MKSLMVEDACVLNSGIAPSFGGEEILQAFCIKEARSLLDGTVERMMISPSPFRWRCCGRGSMRCCGGRVHRSMFISRAGRESHLFGDGRVRRKWEGVSFPDHKSDGKIAGEKTCSLLSKRCRRHGQDSILNGCLRQ